MAEEGRYTLPKGFEYTRWQVERERCQIEDFRPQPPFKEAEPVADAIDGVLRKIGITFSADENRIQNNWPTIVGADLARRTMPGSLKQDTLDVFVMGSVWLAELKRSRLPDMIRCVNAFCGRDLIKRITLLPAPSGYQR